MSWPLPARQNLQAFQRLNTLINLPCLFKYKNMLGIFSVPGKKRKKQEYITFLVKQPI